MGCFATGSMYFNYVHCIYACRGLRQKDPRLCKILNACQNLLREKVAEVGLLGDIYFKLHRRAAEVAMLLR